METPATIYGYEGNNTRPKTDMREVRIVLWERPRLLTMS